MMTVGTITQLTTARGPLPKQITALPPVRSEPMLADADIFEGRAYELRDVAQWLDLNGQKELGRQVRDLAAKVYEIAIEKRKANNDLSGPR